jgi:DNA-directed RNA polymerase subunit RPC12/RpoP
MREEGWSVSDLLLRCSFCGHEEWRPWTEATDRERCPRCTTGRMLRADPRLGEGVRPRNTGP